MSLSKEQLEQFNRIRNSHNGIDQKTYDLCLHYYQQYKQNVEQINPEKMPIVMKTALYVAQKSQFVKTINNEEIPLPSMTLSNLLKNHQPDEVMITLKHFHRDINIEDKVADREVGNLVKDISFFLTFYKKFEKVLRTLELKERHPETGNGQYVKNLTSLTWLFYIQSKRKILYKSVDTIDNTCLLAHTVAFVLCCAWDYILPKSILASEKRINEHSPLKDVMNVIRDKVLEMFLIKSVDIYAPLASKFEDFFDELQRKGTIKSSGQANDFLSPDYLPTNYRKVDKLYEKSMGPADLDQRIFFRERLANLTPSKFTPFARQGNANKGRRGANNNQNNYKDYNSHRILNYEQFDKIESNIKNMNDTTLNVTKLPKNVVISPSATLKPKMMVETPVTAAMGNYAYIHEKSRKARDFLFNGQKRMYEKSVHKHIQHIAELDKVNADKKSKEVREQLIYSFFKWALEEYLCQHPNEQHNEQIYLALMAVSAQIVLFVSNSTITFESLTSQLEVRSFEVWKACDFFASIDRSMPASIKLHLIDVETQYTNYKLWMEKDNVEMVYRISNENITNNLQDRFFKKLLVYTGETITLLGNRLDLTESIKDQVFQTMKTIYSEYSNLLEGNHIDQLIMCAIFAFFKLWESTLSHTLRFQEIIDCYQEVSQYNRDIHDQILHRIPMEGGESRNIADFYNRIFVPAMRTYIRSFKNIDPNEHKRTSNNPTLMSPLKQILPRDLNKKNNKKIIMKDNNSNLLISYTDSPLLRHEPLVIRKSHNSKINKMINFEKDQTELKEEKMAKQYKDKKEQKQYEKLSPRAVNTGQEHKKGTPIQGSAYPWKQPQQPQTPLNINGMTPTRINKTTSAHNTFQLNQFTTNPTVSAKMGGMGQKQQMAFGKGRHYQ